jgi:hypothetical protein
MVSSLKTATGTLGTSDGTPDCGVQACRPLTPATIAAGIMQSNLYASTSQMARVCSKYCCEREIEGRKSTRERQQRSRSWAKNARGPRQNCRCRPRRRGELYGVRWSSDVSRLWAADRPLAWSSVHSGLAPNACGKPSGEPTDGLFEFFDGSYEYLAASRRRYSGSTTSFPQAVSRCRSSKTSGVKLISAPLSGLSGRPCIPPVLLTSSAVPVR